MSRSENFTEGADGVPLRETVCATCGENVYYSAISRRAEVARNPDGSIAQPRRVVDKTARRKDLGLKEGWVHRPKYYPEGGYDHTASPFDGRDPEADVVRQQRSFDSAMIGVKRNLQKKFDYLTAEKTVNDIAKEMGL